VIPKILHFIWMQGRNAMPPEYRRCVESWAPLHPDWHIKLWSRDTIPSLENDWVWGVDNPTVQTDVARVEVVYQLGGVYVDADMECLRPIDELLDGLTAFASMRNRTKIENSGFGATAQHPWLRSLICRISADQSRIKRVLDMDGPFNEISQQFEISTFPYPVFHTSPSPADNGVRDQAYALHHRISRWMYDDERYAEARRRHDRLSA
jgi:hypothetical protein